MPNWLSHRRRRRFSPRRAWSQVELGSVVLVAAVLAAGVSAVGAAYVADVRLRADLRAVASVAVAQADLTRVHGASAVLRSDCSHRPIPPGAVYATLGSAADPPYPGASALASFHRCGLAPVSHASFAVAVVPSVDAGVGRRGAGASARPGTCAVAPGTRHAAAVAPEGVLHDSPGSRGVPDCGSSEFEVVHARGLSADPDPLSFTLAFGGPDGPLSSTACRAVLRYPWPFAVAVAAASTSHPFASATEPLLLRGHSRAFAYDPDDPDNVRTFDDGFDPYDRNPYGGSTAHPVAVRSSGSSLGHPYATRARTLGSGVRFGDVPRSLNLAGDGLDSVATRCTGDDLDRLYVFLTFAGGPATGAY